MAKQTPENAIAPGASSTCATLPALVEKNYLFRGLDANWLENYLSPRT